MSTEPITETGCVFVKRFVRPE